MPTEDLYDEAVLARRDGDLLRAATLFGRAAAEEDDPARSLWLLMRQSNMLANLDRAGEAAAIAEDVLVRSRELGLDLVSADALCVIAGVRLESINVDAGITALAEALSLLEGCTAEPDYANIVQNLAVTYLRNEYANEAIVLLEQSLQRSAGADEETIALINANLVKALVLDALETDDARSLRSAELLRRSVEVATKVLEGGGGTDVRPARAVCLAYRAIARLRLDDAVGAAADAETAISVAGDQLHRERCVASYSLGAARRALGRKDGVLEHLERAVSLSLTFGPRRLTSPALRELAETHRQLGNTDAAFGALLQLSTVLEAEKRAHRAGRVAHIRLGVQLRALERMSVEDPLTSLPNRRYLDQLLGVLSERGTPLVLGVVDLDNFKRINDLYSHGAGDEVLRTVAWALQHHCRRGDTVVRVGGDEFVVVLANTGQRTGDTALERLRAGIAACRWDDIDPALEVTGSIGAIAATLRPGTADDALALADGALRAAKAAGKNRVEVRTLEA
jgi:diguanylate cyclase (GGDEF)-like protein